MTIASSLVTAADARVIAVASSVWVARSVSPQPWHPQRRN
jgi:hypothetical protein